MYDYIIIGAGINGSFMAHELSKYNLNVMVIEKGPDVATGATIANSAIIHAGHDPKPGTLKAKLNVEGNSMYPKICKDLDADFKHTSAFITATSMEESPSIDMLYKQAKGRNIPCEILDKGQAKALEPNLSDNTVKVLNLPSTGIITPWEVTYNLMEEAIINGVELSLNIKVLGIISRPKTCYVDKSQSMGRLGYEIITNKGTFKTANIINAAGVYADEIYNMLKPKESFSITGRKGEYYILDKLANPLVNRVIYPIPSSKGKGVLVVPTVHGNTLLGPSSDFIDDKGGNFTDTETLKYVKAQVNRTVKNIPFNKVIKTYAGLRPTGNTGDFIISESDEFQGFINVAAIESPGLASAPAITKYVLNTIIEKQVILKPKKQYINRTKLPILNRMSLEEKIKLWNKEPKYGNIICRCESISEGEILDAIRRPLGATTVDGIKRRVRPGSGRCQGGFCQPEIINILARELNKPVEEIALFNKDSNIITKGEIN